MHRRILVVDDYLPAATAIARLLRLSGHAVMIASASHEAVPLALDFCPDVIFLDISLGTGDDGLTIAGRLRDEPRLGDTVLVALTGFDGEGQEGRIRAAGFDHFLLKPASLSTMESIIDAAPQLSMAQPRVIRAVG